MKLIRTQKGAAMVELSIALPLILMLLCGTIEFGVLFYNKQIITNASREGVRAGITGLNNTEIKDIVKVSSNKLIGFKNPVSVTDSDIEITLDGNDIKVSVNIAYTFIFSQIIGLENSINISGSTVMRKESV